MMACIVSKNLLSRNQAVSQQTQYIIFTFYQCLRFFGHFLSRNINIALNFVGPKISGPVAQDGASVQVIDQRSHNGISQH